MSRRVVRLNGDQWRLGQVPGEASKAAPGAQAAVFEEMDRVSSWLPATVPGNVRADLQRAGQLPDLTFGLNPEESSWVDSCSWWLVRHFSLESKPDEQVNLVVRGVDYVHDLFFNGQHLGRHEGMFSPRRYKVTTLLESENQLAVRLTGSQWLPQDRSSRWEKLLNRIEARSGGMPGRFPDRRDTLKCQMSFGWDFAPPVRTMGIWDDVLVVVSGGVFIREVTTRPEIAPGKAALDVTVDLDARKAGSIELRCRLLGETFAGDALLEAQTIKVAGGTSRHELRLGIPEPRLWWPWDHGDPDLYRLTVEVLQDGRVVDSVDRIVGLRHAELRGWTWHVNGEPVYARGANWVPVHILPGCVAEADYQKLLDLARQANMNMLRVWGGGLREKRPFYDLCDRLGIMVWQEFPFACSFLTRFPRSLEYLDLVEAEAGAIVRDLRRHPSVVCWCGGNEFSPDRNEPLVSRLRRAVATGDQTRPFLDASPAGGDSHNWKVWHGFQAPATYRDDGAQFASEFGMQAPPDVATLRRFVPEDELWPAGQAWTYHGAELGKLQRYAGPYLSQGQAPTLEAFVEASQRAQAQGLQIAVEHYRRRKAEGCGGVLVWQLNEPWPAISWALVDFFRQPKPAYEAVKRLFNPVLVSVEYARREYRPGDCLSGDLWLINDLSEEMGGCEVEVLLWDGKGQQVERFAQTVDLDSHTASAFGSFCWNLPPGGGWRLTCHLTQNGRLLCGNEYDLTVHDGLGPSLKQRLWAWMAGLVTPA